MRSAKLARLGLLPADINLTSRLGLPFLSFFAFLKKAPYVDPKRMGVTGFCWGGGKTWLTVERFPNDFKAAVAWYGPLKPGPTLGRLHAIWGLGQIRAADRTIPLLDDPDAEVRAQAARVLGDGRAAAAGDALIARLKDSSPRVRYHAALALGKLKPARAQGPLIEMIRENDDRDRLLRHAGVMALAALDSTFFFTLPLGIDAVVVILAARRGTYFWLTPVLATAGLGRLQHVARPSPGRRRRGVNRNVHGASPRRSCAGRIADAASQPPSVPRLPSVLELASNVSPARGAVTAGVAPNWKNSIVMLMLACWPSTGRFRASSIRRTR